MYKNYWGLNDSPFRGALDPRYFHNSPSHDEALARMQFMVENQRRLGLMLGGAGSGKSLSLEVFSRRLRSAGKQVALVRLLGMDGNEFIWRLAYELGEDPDADATSSCLWRLIADRLLVNRYQQVDTVLLLDDADEARHDVLTSITRLAQWEPIPESRLTILLTAHEHRMERLGRRLLELCELRIELLPWDQDDTAEYLKATLAKAGRQTPVFDVPAISRLHELSEGVPRRVRQLAELSLLAGAGQEFELIDEDTVNAVNEELSVASRELIVS